MLAWSDQFATGNALVDAAHKMLFDKINALEELLAGPPPTPAQCDALLGFLGSYVVTHFRHEENCMWQHRCPAHEKNKAAHATFLEAFAAFKARYAAQGPDPALLRELHGVAASWIRNHIMTIDVQLKAATA